MEQEKFTGAKPAGEPLSKDKLECHIKSMMADFMSNGSNVDEFLMSMEEILSTPSAGIRLVIGYGTIMDCKPDKHKAIYHIITILVEKGKLTKEDVRDGLMIF